MQAPSDALDRFDEIAERCDLDGVGRASEDPERDEKLQRYIDAVNEAISENVEGEDIDAAVEVPAAFIDLMKLVDAILGAGLPHYRSKHQTPFFEGFDTDEIDIGECMISKPADERQARVGLDGDWEVGAGWTTGEGAGADSYVLYCRSQDLERDWKRSYLVKDSEGFDHLGPMDDLGEFLKAYATFNAPDLNSLSIDTQDPFK